MASRLPMHTPECQSIVKPVSPHYLTYYAPGTAKASEGLIEYNNQYKDVSCKFYENHIYHITPTVAHCACDVLSVTTKQTGLPRGVSCPQVCLHSSRCNELNAFPTS